MTPEEQKIEEAAKKFLRLRIISKGGYVENGEVKGETVSGYNNVMTDIILRTPNLVEFSCTNEAVKEYWQKGMYSEEEVRGFINSLLDYHKIQLTDPVTKAWIDNFEQNKKK